MTKSKLFRIFLILCVLVVTLTIYNMKIPKSHPCLTSEYCGGTFNLSKYFKGDDIDSDDALRSAFEKLKQPFPQRTRTYNWVVPEYIIKNRRNPHLQKINCNRLFEGNQAEVTNAKKYMKEVAQASLSEEDIIRMTSSSADACVTMRRHRGYLERPLSQEEYDFPIAFSILLYKDVQQVERLLRAIYQPQNWYCLHVDSRAKNSTKRALRSLANCFPNVFVAKELYKVYWGHISIMDAEKSCIKELLHKPRWKYFINLSGQMLPLQTNRNLVKILKMFDGANDIEGTYKRSSVWWLRVRQILSWYLVESLNTMMVSGKLKTSPPYNVKVYKGSNQVAITREFAIYFVHSEQAREITEWFSDTLAPDEYIWPTINHNPTIKAPGSYTGDPETKKSTVRASVWLPIANQINWSWDHWDCHGKWVRQICIFGIGDLPWLQQRPELFVNKFHYDFEWLAYDCLEDLIFNRTLSGNKAPLNVNYYEELAFVKHKEQIIKFDRNNGGRI